MPRNVAKDIEEEKRRRKQLLETAFELFSKYGIDNVKLSDIALKADVGIATLYKYYKNKVNLVVEISAYIWKNSINEVMLEHPNGLESYNAYQIIELYLDYIINIYNKHPEMLRFSGNYKSFINREDVVSKDTLPHTSVLDIVGEIFHKKYIEAKTDKSIRTDIEEKDIYFMCTITMLSMAERYALGLVWEEDAHNGNYLKELLYLKDMILRWVKN